VSLVPVGAELTTARATPGSSLAASSTTDPCRARHRAAAKPMPALPPITTETVPAISGPVGQAESAM
jgi:hypothetical protein